jgi:hypothetical protein
MFTDETERRDWIFGALVTVFIVGALIWLNSLPDNSKKTASEIAAEPPVESAGAVPLIPNPEPVSFVLEDEFVEKRNSIARVFECERNGQRVISDRPCGPDAAVREIQAPNRMNRQDTRPLYRPAPASIQRQQARGRSSAGGGSNKQLCASIEEQIDVINARMRRGYRSWEGERYRERLRQLSAERWDAGCGR